MVVRKDYLRASKAMQERVMKTPNIEVLFGYTTVEVLGDENGVTGALVRHTGGEEKVIDAFGFFLGIGHHPNTQLFEGQLELDKEGYVKTVPGSSQTSVKGVSQPETCRIRGIARPLRLRDRDVWRRSTANVICWTFSACNRICVATERMVK